MGRKEAFLSKWLGYRGQPCLNDLSPCGEPFLNGNGETHTGFPGNGGLDDDIDPVLSDEH